ncbi:MAG TPA: tyrosine-type recombinase/integrase [Chitinivibrionales bacterium]|nr:tyrosine-type recombinase/integrase [Chitinivibrionales bacterium]
MNIEQLDAELWLLDARVTKDGIQYRKRLRFNGSRKDAELRYWMLKNELHEKAKNSNRSLNLKVTTLEHIIDYYLARHEVPHNSICYFNRLKRDLGGVELDDLRDRFDKYLLLLRKTKSKRTGQVYSNQTINHMLKWARSAINFCLRNGQVEKNPLQYFGMLKTVPRSRVLTQEEKDRLLAVVKEEAPRLYPMLLFSFLVPSRRGELTSLKRTDYDMVNNCIIIPGDRTKNGKTCVKPVPDCLKEYMRNVPVESEYLFYRQDWRGNYHSLGDFHKSMRRCIRLAGIDNFRFHDTRRQAYTDLLLAGNAPHIVMQVSGHSTDMSKVYFGRDGLYAAKALKFATTCTNDKYSQGGDVAIPQDCKDLGV